MIFIAEVKSGLTDYCLAAARMMLVSDSVEDAPWRGRSNRLRQQSDSQDSNDMEALLPHTAANTSAMQRHLQNHHSSLLKSTAPVKKMLEVPLHLNFHSQAL